jgi:hypothetical protein
MTRLHCVLCPAHPEETTFHMFVACPFNQACWHHLGIHWRFDLTFHTLMEEAKKQFQLFILHGNLFSWSLANLEAKE